MWRTLCVSAYVCAHVYKLWMARAGGEWPHKLQLPERLERDRTKPKQSQSEHRHMTQTGGLVEGQRSERERQR